MNNIQTNTDGISLLLPNQFQTSADERGEHWVQLSPFGDFPNANAGTPIVQRFRHEDAARVCEEFNGPLRRLAQPFGMPFYIGHPDHPAFTGHAGHEDTRAYGRGKEMRVRHDDACPKCHAYVENPRGKGISPCPDHGLFVRVRWNKDGARLIENESFHGHSVNWVAVPDGRETGVYRPIRVKSAGFTNEPNIPVAPATLANENAGETEPPGTLAAVPPRLKLLAGFREDDDVTLEQVIEALEKAREVLPAANAASVVQLEARLADERRSRAILAADALIASGRLMVKDRECAVAGLCGAGDEFDAVARRLANAEPVIKIQPVSTNLAWQNARAADGERERAAQFQQLIDRRQRDFPNEGYDDCFRAVADSGDGARLLAMMSRRGVEE